MNGLETMKAEAVSAVEQLVADVNNAQVYLVNFATDPAAPINGAWIETPATSHEKAALTALESCINFYAPFGTVYARVHGPNDAKHGNGNPALIHSFTLRIGAEVRP